MNILVIGCDQVGASLVRDLEHIGHDISLIEKDPEQLKRLDAWITPAYAGKSDLGSVGKHLHGDHPRICGEKSRVAHPG